MKRLGLAFTLGGMQGFIGWWMVKSGLETPENTYGPIHVSPYRLAVHLISAFGIYGLLFNTALQVWPKQHIGHGINNENLQALKKLR
jgi:cytochrome c oxidase assembly protein subunit 15